MGYRGVIGVAIAGSMIFSSTGAVAAAAPPVTQPDPWAALSVMSGGASAAAVCGAAAVAAAAAQPMAGCVLPQADIAPVGAPVGPAPLPAAYTPVSGPPIPVLLVWAAVLGTMVYILLRHNHHHVVPNSPV